MSKDLERSQLLSQGFEQVYVELDWYDGLRLGLADVGGEPHYFEAVNGYNVGNNNDGLYRIWPAPPEVWKLEQQQWRHFVEWHSRYKRGDATSAEHPGSGGVDQHYDRIEADLARHRVAPPGALILRASWHPLAQPVRYRPEGLEILVRWAADDTPGAI